MADKEKDNKNKPKNNSKETKQETKKDSKKSSPGTKVAEFRFNFDIKTIFIIVFFSLFLFTLFAVSSEYGQPQLEKTLSELLQDVNEDRVKSVTVRGNKLISEYADGTEYQTTFEGTDSFISILNNANVDPTKVNISVEDTQGYAWLATFFIQLIPVLIIVGVFFLIYRQAKGSQDSIFSFGQSRAKRFNKDLPKIKFKDVAGVKEAVQETEEIVDFLKNPKKYQKVGARTPKGVILVGPAGTGKTLLAKAVAGEASVPFYSIAGSEFMEMLVGIGAARVRDLFQTAKKNAPAIIFIDEVDAIGRARSTGGGMPAHDEREQTLNQILVEMDGFNPNDQVVVMAATNRGDLLDSALLRPGRFDRRIVIDYPDASGRLEIMKIHAKGKPFNADMNWDRIADRTVGFSGADLENMLNEAAILAARKGNKEISYEDVEEAATKVKLGPEKKRLQTDLDKKITAYHEAGHAIVSHYLQHTDLVQRISIVSRGMALGFTLMPPSRDKLHTSKTSLIERLAVMMGGRAAEETIFNEVTTGAANDFVQATRLARAMVTEYGMSKLGYVNYSDNSDITQFGSYMGQAQISQEMLAKIDIEIKRIVDEAYEKAVEIIKKQRKQMDTVAEELLKKENMDQDEFEKIVGEKKGHSKKKRTESKQEKKDKVSPEAVSTESKGKKTVTKKPAKKKSQKTEA